MTGARPGSRWATSSPTRATPGTHQWYDGTQHPWEFKRVWHLEPSLTDPDTVYAGVEDAALFKSTDGGKRWRSCPACGARKANSGNPARAACVCTPSCSIRATRSASSSPSRPPAPFAATTAAKSWKPINRGLNLAVRVPDPTAEVGHCVHRIAMHRSRPDVLFMQKHWDVMRSDDAGDNWHEVSGNLPIDFGFPIDVHAHEPETDLRRADQERLRAFPAGRKAARLSQPDRGQRMGSR